MIAYIRVAELVPYLVAAWILTERFGVIGAASVWSAGCALDSVLLFGVARRVASFPWLPLSDRRLRSLAGPVTLAGTAMLLARHQRAYRPARLGRCPRSGVWGSGVVRDPDQPGAARAHGVGRPRPGRPTGDAAGAARRPAAQIFPARSGTQRPRAPRHARVLSRRPVRRARASDPGAQPSPRVWRALSDPLVTVQSMRALHGVWARESLCLWAEDPSRPAAPPSRCRPPRRTRSPARLASWPTSWPRCPGRPGRRLARPSTTSSRCSCRRPLARPRPLHLARARPAARRDRIART